METKILAYAIGHVEYRQTTLEIVPAEEYGYQYNFTRESEGVVRMCKEVNTVFRNEDEAKAVIEKIVADLLAAGGEIIEYNYGEDFDKLPMTTVKTGFMDVDPIIAKYATPVKDEAFQRDLDYITTIDQMEGSPWMGADSDDLLAELTAWEEAHGEWPYEVSKERVVEILDAN